MSGASYIKEVNQLTFGTDGKESSFAGGSIEAKNITVKGRLWTAKGTSIDTSGELLFVNNPQIDSPEDTKNIKVLNCGTINADSIESPIYFRNQGTIVVKNAINAGVGFKNEKTTASITADELIVKKDFNNIGNISVNSITANLDISKNLVNDSDAAIIQTNKITVTSGGIINKGTITSKDENSKVAISSAGKVNNMGKLLKISSLTSNNGITNATGAIIQTDKINNTRGDIINNGSLKSTTEINSVGTIDNYGVLKTKNLISNTRLYNRQGATLETESIDGATGTISNYGTLRNQNKIESYGAIYNRGQLKSNILVSKSTVTNGGFNNDKDSADPNSKMEVGSLKAEAIINNGQLIADSVETQKNIANGNSAALNINNTLKIEGILKNAGSLETKDLIISQASDNANRDSYSTGSLKVNGKLTLNENAGFSFEDKREGGDISIGTLETKGNNVISVKNGVTDINVGTLDGNNTIINVESDAADQIKIDQNNDEGLTVKGTGEMTDYYGDDIAGGLNKLKDTVGIKDGNKKPR